MDVSTSSEQDDVPEMDAKLPTDNMQPERHPGGNVGGPPPGNYPKI